MPDLNDYPQYQAQPPVPPQAPQNPQNPQPQNAFPPASPAAPAQAGPSSYPPQGYTEHGAYGSPAQGGIPQPSQQSPQPQAPRQAGPQGNPAPPAGFPGYTYETAPGTYNGVPYGAPGAPAPLPQKKRRLWKVLVPVCSVALVLVVLAAVFLPKLLTASSPRDRLGQAFSNTFSSLIDNPNSPSSVFASMGSALQKGKTSFDLQVEENAMTYTPAVGIGGSLTTDLSQKAGLLELNVSYAGQEMLGGSLYFGPDQLSVSLPAVLGDTAYGLSPKDIRGQMEKSPWMLSQGLTPDDVDGLDEMQEVLDSLFANAAGDEDALKELQDELYAVFMEDFSKVEPEEERSSVSVRGQHVSASILRYTFEEQDVVDLFAHLMDALAESDNLEALLSIGGLSDSLSGSSADSFDSGLEDFRASLQEAADSFADFYTGEITAEFAIDGQNRLVYMDLSLDPQDEESGISSASIRGEFGPDFSEDSGFVLEFTVADSYGDETALRVDSQDTVNDGQYKNETTLMVDQYGYTSQLDFTTEWDKDSGNFSFAMSVPTVGTEANSLTAYGTLTGDDSSCTLDLEKVSFSSGGEDQFSFSLKLSSDSAAELKKPAMKNIFELSEEELADLSYSLQSAFGSGSSYSGSLF